MSSAAPTEQKDAEATPPTPATVKAAAEQFDKEFQKYTTKLPGKSARAVALARAELAKATAVLWQDKKLEQAKAKKGRLSPEQRAFYEKRVRDLERAIDDFHKSVAGYNVNKAVYVAASGCVRPDEMTMVAYGE
jgi:hypothetical protein